MAKRRGPTLRQQLEMADGCLDMVREKLVHALGGEDQMAGCPPMMYPEAIHNAINRHVRLAIDSAVNSFLNSTHRKADSITVAEFTLRTKDHYLATLKVEADVEEKRAQSNTSVDADA